VAAGETVSSLLKADGAQVCWTERRPSEAGRVAVMRRTADGTVEDLIAAPFSARSRVHEYGGGAIAARNGTIVFVNDADQNLYILEDDAPRCVADRSDLRFADMDIRPDSSGLFAVAERHDPDLDHPQNTLVHVALNNPVLASADTVLAGRDFYASPRISPDGRHLAWLAWDLPAMPWEAAELWVGSIAPDGGVSDAKRVAEHGAFQPVWAEDGRLYVIADHRGWGVPHVWDGADLKPIVSGEIEFGRPQWAFGMTSYAVLEPGRLLATGWQDGRIVLGVVNGEQKSWTALESSFTRVDDIAVSTDRIAIIGSDDVSGVAVHTFPRETTAFTPNGSSALPQDCLLYTSPSPRD